MMLCELPVGLCDALPATLPRREIELQLRALASGRTRQGYPPKTKCFTAIRPPLASLPDFYFETFFLVPPWTPPYPSALVLITRTSRSLPLHGCKDPQQASENGADD